MYIGAMFELDLILQSFLCIPVIKDIGDVTIITELITIKIRGARLFYHSSFREGSELHQQGICSRISLLNCYGLT